MKQLSINHISAASIRANRKTYLSLAVGIVLAVLLATVMTLCAFGLIKALERKAVQIVGWTDCILLDEPDITDESLRQSGLFDRIGHQFVAASVTDSNVYLGWLDEAGQDVLCRAPAEGRMPEQRGEIAIERSALERLRLESEIGDTVTWTLLPVDGVPGTPPMTLLDYFPEDFLLFVDESHVTLPQVRAMYNGDRSRKESLVEYGFRLPSAFDNRPLTFPEFQSKIHQAVYVSATPAPYETERAGQIVEQVIRPTGLLDPEVEVRPIEGQVDDLMEEIAKVTAKEERVLVTTLTKRMAEDLTTFLQKNGVRVRYMHSDIGAMERMEIIRDLRMAKFDVLVGINLLREGLDLPEVSLVAILDADKEGFLRSPTSLIQTIGRAARNADGRVIMYADGVTPAMDYAIRETNRRRGIQQSYNEAHGIIPKTIRKDVRELIEISRQDAEAFGKGGMKLTKEEREREIARLEKQMRKAAQMMEFEFAAVLRDQIIQLRGGK